MARPALTLLVIVVLLASLPAVAAAETRSGGTIVVGEGETVDDDLQAYAGSVVVRGTVAGDLTVAGGDLQIAESGTVRGDVEASGGSVVIAGSVTGDVNIGSGSARITETAQIDGKLQAGAGSIYVDGAVGDGATLGADRITLGPNAQIAGNLTYDGELTRADGSSVDGSVTREEGTEPGAGSTFDFGGPVFTLYGVLVSFLLGAVLLFAFPGFSRGVAGRVTDAPVRTGGIGMLVAIGVMVGIVLLLFTIVGIPLSLAGFVLFLLLLWVASVYGRYALGEWVLSYTDWDSPWLALALGVVLVALLAMVPVLGRLVTTVVLLLGFGALVLGLWRAYQNRDADGPAAGPDTEAA